MLALIEPLAALAFLLIIVIGHYKAAVESKKRAAEAAKEAAIPRINRTLEDARRLGCPL